MDNIAPFIYVKGFVSNKDWTRSELIYLSTIGILGEIIPCHGGCLVHYTILSILVSGIFGSCDDIWPNVFWKTKSTSLCLKATRLG